MVRAGIKDLKNNLSRYLSRVKEGEEVYVTERGKAIARIVKEPGKGRTRMNRLLVLASIGMIKRPTRDPLKKRQKPVKSKGKPASEMIIEDRG